MKTRCSPAAFASYYQIIQTAKRARQS